MLPTYHNQGQDEGRGRCIDSWCCGVGAPNVISKHQTNTLLLPVIMSIVVNTISSDQQNGLCHILMTDGCQPSAEQDN